MSNIEVTNIKVGYADGKYGFSQPFVYFDVRVVDEDGDEVYNDGHGDWIDLNDGLLVIHETSASNMYCNPEGLSCDQIGEVHGIVNDYLEENPIPESELQKYRDSMEAAEKRVAKEEEAYRDAM